MANLIPVTAEQYARVLAFRDACHAVAAVFATLKKTRLPPLEDYDGPSADGCWRMLQRQAKQLDDVGETPPAPPALANQKLKQVGKLKTSAFRAALLLDLLRDAGIGIEGDWTDMRAQAMGLADLPKGT